MLKADKNVSTKNDANRFLLVVDSDANDLFYTSMLLQRFEYNIGTARSASEAVEISFIAVPSLIITDLKLKDSSGVELIRRLRQERLTNNIQVIVKTDEWTPEKERHCLQEGACACIRSPVQAEELYRAVQAAIEKTPRKTIRINTLLSVSVNNIPLHCGAGECASVLSEQGMYIRTLKPYPQKSQVTIQIKIQEHIVGLEAVVLYSNKYSDGPNVEPGMGLQFTRITPHDQGLIREFIRQELHRGIRPL